MKKQRIVLLVNNQRGVSAVVIAICLFMLVAFVALALDTIHLVVARNELQNAADAGALAGARFLYLEDGTAIDPLANQKAYEAAIANASDQQAVEVYDHMSNQKDVRRGHWSFTTRTFTPNDSLEPVELWKYSTT
jgi:Flp pilus assembly protein TadG